MVVLCPSELYCMIREESAVFSLGWVLCQVQPGLGIWYEESIHGYLWLLNCNELTARHLSPSVALVLLACTYTISWEIDRADLKNVIYVSQCVLWINHAYNLSLDSTRWQVSSELDSVLLSAFHLFSAATLLLQLWPTQLMIWESSSCQSCWDNHVGTVRKEWYSRVVLILRWPLEVVVFLSTLLTSRDVQWSMADKLQECLPTQDPADYSF